MSLNAVLSLPQGWTDDSSWPAGTFEVRERNTVSSINGDAAQIDQREGTHRCAAAKH